MTPSSTAQAVFSTVSYAGLRASDPSALATLYHAASSEGFFYLDLADTNNLTIVNDTTQLFLQSKALFDLPHSEKMLYDTHKLGHLRNYG